MEKDIKYENPRGKFKVKKMERSDFDIYFEFDQKFSVEQGMNYSYKLLGRNKRIRAISIVPAVDNVYEVTIKLQLK